MEQGNNLAVILVEFDTIKGPSIRKTVPKNYNFPEGVDFDSILMWILRASEFSARKIIEQIAYAKNISLDDPNFNRKKRQFGFAIISKELIELKKAEQYFNKLIQEIQIKANNKSYFKMLNELIEATNLFQNLVNELTDVRIQEQLSIKSEDEQNISKNNSLIEGTNQYEQFLLMSKKLLVFNKVKIWDIKKEAIFIISSVEGFGKIDRDIGEIIEITTNSFKYYIDIRDYHPLELDQGFELLSKIFESISDDNQNNQRFVIAIEFLDRLLYEQVDIEYYLPFLQYLVAMEKYTITEFQNEEFNKQLHNLKETHGEWIQSLSNENLDGKKLTDFFRITGIRREGLELLVDLLFIKIIAIY